VCPDPALFFLPSKRRHGSTGLASRKALKTAPASAAGAALGLAGRLASTQGALEQGAQAAQVVVGRAPEADPSVEAAVVPRETAGEATASSPPDVLPVLAPASAEAVAVLAWSHPSPPTLSRSRRRYLMPRRREAQNRDPSWKRQPCPRAEQSRRAASVAPVLDSWCFGSPLRS
jgi:hypothetical protein